MQSCAVDPGAVSSNIYANSRLPSPIRWLIQNLHAPARDGANAVIHAATIPLPPATVQPGQQYMPEHKELRVRDFLVALDCWSCVPVWSCVVFTISAAMCVNDKSCVTVLLIALACCSCREILFMAAVCRLPQLPWVHLPLQAVRKVVGLTISQSCLCSHKTLRASAALKHD